MDPLTTPHLAALAWLLICSGLVFFMQTGFCAVESGMVRYKNSINVALKNVVDFCTSFAAFMVLGYSLMFSPSWDPFGLIVIGGVSSFGSKSKPSSGLSKASVCLLYTSPSPRD